MLTGQNVREIVKCRSCSKPRCIYSNANLSNWEQRELRKIIRTYEYVCECLITLDVSFLSGTLFRQLEMHCKSLLNGLITVQVKQIQERTCVAIVAKLVLKLIRTRRSYTKASFLCAINVKHRERKSWRGGRYKPPKQTNRGSVVLKTIDKFIFKILRNKSIH